MAFDQYINDVASYGDARFTPYPVENMGPSAPALQNVDAGDDNALDAHPTIQAMVNGYAERVYRRADDASASARIKVNGDPIEGYLRIKTVVEMTVPEVAMNNFLRMQGLSSWADIERQPPLQRLRTLSVFLAYAEIE